MKAMLLLYTNEAMWSAMSRSERAQATQPYMDYAKALQAAGKMIGGNELAYGRDSKKIVGETLRVVDGPYADTKEQLGGYFLIDVVDWDEAIAWAKRCPAALEGGVVEIRPLMSQD